MYLPPDVLHMITLNPDEKIMNCYDPIVPMIRFNFNTGIIEANDIEPGVGYLVVTNQRLIISCAGLNKPFRLLMNEKLEDIIPEITKISPNSRNHVLQIQGKFFHFGDDAISVIEMIWALRKKRLSDIDKQNTRFNSQPIQPIQQLPFNINIGRVGDETTTIKDSVLQRSNIGGKENKPFNICPYCGEELNLSKTPKYCPYCKEQLS